MKNSGYLLISCGFLGGAYLTSLDAATVQWGPFVVTLAVGLAGIMLVQVASRQLARAEDKIAANISLLESSLTNLVSKVSKLNSDKATIDPYDMRLKIDEQLLDDLITFAEARETIAHVHGLPAYAEVMSNFAGGERYLNRIWCASADGYIDEVYEYLDKAQKQFSEAQQKLQQMMLAKSGRI